MLLFKYIPIAIESFLLHKLRSSLSILGIICGVGAVIVATSIGEGARKEIMDAIKLMGINNLTVRKLSLSESKEIEAAKNLSDGLTQKDAQKIKEILRPLVKNIAPVKYSYQNVNFKNKEMSARIVGTVPDYKDVYQIILKKGRFLSKKDLNKKNRVCILGMDVKKNLFSFQNPVGAMIKINEEWYWVIGWLENKNIPKIKGDILKTHDTNKDIYIPLSTAFLSLGRGNAIEEIAIKAIDSTRLTELSQTIRSILDRSHNNVKDYEVVIPRELLKQSQRSRHIFNIFMACIAGISLLVGGIGIMNIMLATVTERTKEIGIRRAVGASQKDIIRQFLTESVLLTLAGGIAGVVLGSFSAYMISQWVQWKAIVSFEAVILAFIVSGMVGIIFGIYPAYKGAKMDPIVALQYG